MTDISIQYFLFLNLFYQEQLVDVIEAKLDKDENGREQLNDFINYMVSYNGQNMDWKANQRTIVWKLSTEHEMDLWAYLPLFLREDCVIKAFSKFLNA